MISPRRARDIQQSRDVVYSNVGHSVVWKNVKSTTGGSPEYGIEPSVTYVSKTIKVLLTPPELGEIQQSGGMIVAGDIWCTMREMPDRRDYIEWQGKLYEMATEPSPVQFGNAVWYRVLLKRVGESR